MLLPTAQPGADGTSQQRLCRNRQRGGAGSLVSAPPLGCRSMGAAPQAQDTVITQSGLQLTLMKWPGGGWPPATRPPSPKGFPRAPASIGCSAEVVRDQTRDKLGKDKEIPRLLYLFVSLIAIFAYLWWCIKYFSIFGLTGFVLWGRFPRALQR